MFMGYSKCHLHRFDFYPCNLSKLHTLYLLIYVSKEWTFHTEEQTYMYKMFVQMYVEAVYHFRIF